ncbi:NAD(P)/FAD-dependent oxidoreductase [candidate division KSB1 bacterium]|nr:NAD(P)/FAD-dependent oxidoreductase [candidate division KSB1 bacterium]
MIYSKVIIIGGGPAGSTCGWKLKQNGIECLILDKQEFPRTKLCAGWITPRVINDLKIDINDYPFSLAEFNKFHVHIYNKELIIKVRQYAVRRYEFDHWLLQRSGVNIYTHEVKHIKKDGDYYVIDDFYYCKYLVGAGGTFCPVYRTFFRDIHPRAKDLLVVTLEEEFPYDYFDANCHLWFLRNKLPGYSWYVPKNNGYLNVGIGGFAEKLKANNDNIKNQWQFFINELERLSLVKNHRFNAGGYVYYIRNRVDAVQKDSIYLIGDASGLATRDMGEGIGPAVKSGILAAEAISSGKPFSLGPVRKYSFSRYRTAAKLFVAYLINKRAGIE